MSRATAWLRAIIIDPKKREVRQERIENSLEAMQKAVGGYIELVHLDCLGPDDLYCDEEGKVKLFNESYDPGAFLMRGREHDPFIGSCLILGGCDSDGEVTETTWSPEEIEEFVTWL